MDTNELPGCCGVGVISNFGGTDGDSPVEAKDLGYALEELQDNHSYALLTLNQAQKDAGLTKLVEKRRFKLLATFKNGNTANKVYIYGRKV